MEERFPKIISDFTKSQCEDYLKVYPNSLRADEVRNRLKILSSAHGERMGDKNNSSEKQLKDESVAKPDYGTIVLKVLASIAIMGVVVLIGSHFKWIATSTAAGLGYLGMRQLWGK